MSMLRILFLWIFPAIFALVASFDVVDVGLVAVAIKHEPHINSLFFSPNAINTIHIKYFIMNSEADLNVIQDTRSAREREREK